MINLAGASWLYKNKIQSLYKNKEFLYTSPKEIYSELVVQNIIKTEIPNFRRISTNSKIYSLLTGLAFYDSSMTLHDENIGIISCTYNGALEAELTRRAQAMGLDVGAASVEARPTMVRTGMVPERDKAISYNPADLPSYPAGTDVSASDVVSACMKVFARDGRVVSVDADLGSTSGLEGGVSAVDQHRGINVGIAESNMMCVGEAFAALGYNAWVSTFCPFFDWKVLRRIAVGYQERLESMASPDGWLSAGHGLDLTFLATAPNFETKTNGATHMGNDDTVVFSGIAGLRIIDVSCPNQLVGGLAVGHGRQSWTQLYPDHALAVGCSLRARSAVRVRKSVYPHR